jgi:hypothetical protein
MAASQVALLGSTGRPVTGVFQTLSGGKASQLVPGRTTAAPPAPEPGEGHEFGEAARAELPVPATTVASAITAAPMATLRDSEQTLLIVFLFR